MIISESLYGMLDVAGALNWNRWIDYVMMLETCAILFTL